MKLIFKLSLILIVPVAIVFVMYVQHLTRQVTEKFAGPKWDIPSKVYSDSFHVYPGQNMKTIHLKEKLERRGYHEVEGTPDSADAENSIERPGEYKQTHPSKWFIYLNDFQFPNREVKGFKITLELDGDVISEITSYAKNREENLDSIELEPELLTEFFQTSREDRQIVKLEGVPPNLLNAIISVEDNRFLEHSGVDPKGIIRAFLANIKARSIVQGGSTITQQLVKNFFLTQKRSLVRKFNEAIMAIIIESRYSKDTILEAYVNEVYMGQKGTAGIYGVSEGARYYFSKALEHLTLAECAMLAGIIRGPGVFSPFRNKKLALKRRNLVLQKMLETNTILKNEYDLSITEPLRPKKIMTSTNIAPYFVDFVKKELLENYSEKVITTQGLRIFTTLDVDDQLAADDAVRTSLASLERTFPHLKTAYSGEDGSKMSLQAAFIVIQPQTGYVRALIGGRSYAESQFNRVIQSKRQPGSLFKPFVYLSAFLKDPKKYHLSDVISNEPFTHTYDQKVWEPENYESKKEEEEKLKVTIREAIEQSINIPTARVAVDVGIKHLVRTAHLLGIESPLPQVPSLALGSAEVTPLEMAKAYSTLANGGVLATPISIKDVTDNEGHVLEKRSIEVRGVIPPEASFLVTHALQGVIKSGTGRGVQMFGLNLPIAGKTGTTNDYMDAWFAGYTPDTVAVSWVGFDKEKKLGLTGAQAALPIWARFMAKSTQGKTVKEFLIPENIVFKEIDPETGALSSKKCPSSVKEAYIKGSEPTVICELHNPKKKKRRK